jgi:Asp-tRNA(Asn)/Glu-tRNA(Gln) amidotransferase A subunit family amidase
LPRGRPHAAQRQALHADEDRGAGVSAALDAVTDALAAAHRHAELGAFWWLVDDRALQRAAQLDGAVGLPLARIPLAVKDSFDVAGSPTTGGLRSAHRCARSDAEAVRLLERAGAVVIGKTAMDPLAWSTHGQADGFPPCLNPVDRALSPGGSSAGSAVAVAAGIVPLALGTDTAGSIRIPAAYCGVVGLKPAFGVVSLDGCLPLSASCDTVGLLAKTVAGCAAAYDAQLARSRTPTSALAAAERERSDGPIGVLTDLFEASDPTVAAVCSEAMGRLEAAGASLEAVTLGWWAPRLGLLLAVELAAAWGAQAEADPGRFPPVILTAIERARAIPAARYEQVLAELQAGREQLERRLSRFSALLSPTVPVPVPGLDEEDVAVSTRFTRIFNALGWPALSVPCGSDSRGRPVGMHVATARTVEDAVAVAAQVERATAAA